MTSPSLSICIATYARGTYIAETLEDILAQCTDEVEVVVVDGASPDNTMDAVRKVQDRHPRLRYVREEINSGVDQDFDKAVGYARGEYCWLLSDDDLLAPGAIGAVMEALRREPDLVVVNAEVRDKTMRTLLKPRQLEATARCSYDGGEMEALLAETAGHLTFIGAVVVRRAVWLARQRAAYYGSLFIHVGVLFQPPALDRVIVLTEPLVRIRYGNAMWSSRGFEIWVEKWPRLVWSFDHLDASFREAVTPRYPAQSVRTLLWHRAIGAYGRQEYRELLVARRVPYHPLAWWIASLPAVLANAAAAFYLQFSRPPDLALKLYELSRARCASRLARRLYEGVSARNSVAS